MPAILLKRINVELPGEVYERYQEASPARGEPGEKHKIEFPLIRSANPGSIEFSNAEFEQFSAEEDLEGDGKSSGC